MCSSWACSVVVPELGGKTRLDDHDRYVVALRGTAGKGDDVLGYGLDDALGEPLFERQALEPRRSIEGGGWERQRQDGKNEKRASTQLRDTQRTGPSLR